MATSVEEFEFPNKIVAREREVSITKDLKADGHSVSRTTITPNRAGGGVILTIECS